MIITRTTPVSKSYDSYTVEIKTMIGDADGYSHITMGPFKRVEHWENLKNLLELLSAMKKSSFYENYNDVVGFLQWFNAEVKTLDDLEKHYFYFYDDDDDEKKEEKKQHEAAFSLSKGFVKEWPYDPRTDEGYQQSLDEFKVFYCDYTGTIYNTEVTL
jgi:hypothetical protein